MIYIQAASGWEINIIENILLKQLLRNNHIIGTVKQILE